MEMTLSQVPNTKIIFMNIFPPDPNELAIWNIKKT